MILKQPVDQVKYFQKLIRAEPGYKGLQELIIGKFLKIENNGVFIGIPIGPDTHHAFVCFNKIV